MRMRTPEGKNVMVEIIGTTLLEKIPIDIPLRDCLSYFPGNRNVIIWKLLIKTQKSSFFRNYMF